MNATDQRELAAKLLAGMVPTAWYACPSCRDRWERWSPMVARPCPECGKTPTQIKVLPDCYGHDLERLLRAIAEWSK